MVTVQPPAPGGTVRPLNESTPVWLSRKLFDEAPVQVPPAAPATATCMLMSVSVKLAPVSGMLSAFTSVKVTTEIAPIWMVEGVNEVAMDGGAVTTSEAVLEGGPAGRSAVVAPLVVFVCVPAELLVTVKVTVQPAAGRLMPLKLRFVWPTVSDAGVVPVQVPPTLTAPTDMPVRASVKLPFVWATPLGLVSESVTPIVPPLWMRLAAKDLEMPMTPTPSCAELEAAPATTVSVVVTPLAVLLYGPEVALFTCKEMVQVAPAGSATPVGLKAVAPAATLAGKPVQPPEVVTAPPTACSGDGKASVKEAPVSGVAALGLARVKVSVALAPGATAEGENDFAKVGRESSVALAGATLVTFSELVKFAAGIVSR